MELAWLYLGFGPARSRTATGRAQAGRTWASSKRQPGADRMAARVGELVVSVPVLSRTTMEAYPAAEHRNETTARATTGTRARVRLARL